MVNYLLFSLFFMILLPEMDENRFPLVSLELLETYLERPFDKLHRAYFSDSTLAVVFSIDLFGCVDSISDNPLRMFLLMSDLCCFIEGIISRDVIRGNSFHKFVDKMVAISHLLYLVSSVMCLCLCSVINMTNVYFL